MVRNPNLPSRGLHSRAGYLLGIEFINEGSGVESRWTIKAIEGNRTKVIRRLKKWRGGLVHRHQRKF